MPLDAATVARTAFARAIRPDPERSVAEWADAERVLGNEEGPYPGAWRTDRTPYLREPMEVASLSHPCRKVTLKFSAQTGKTQVPLNLLGQIATETPAACLVVLPSIDEARAWNRSKLQPMIDNSPRVRNAVLDVKSRDEASSTVMAKRFRGGIIELTGANSSKGLQMRTVRVLISDEVSEFPWDVDGRGDPLAMAERRYEFFTGREKDLASSTPSLLGLCRITTRYEASSKGRYHVACPHCDERQPLDFVQLRWAPGQPQTAAYHCTACGAAIQHRQKAAMMAEGRWVHERPELLTLHAGYALNALYSPAIDWATVAARYEASREDPAQEKVFVQQTLGEAYEQRHDVVPHQVLWNRRTTWPAGRIPPACLFLVAATDVQGDRLEWAVYGIDRNFGQWWIDGGILIGDPLQAEVWQAHDELVGRKWRDAWGRDWSPESWGIDSGYHSQAVYRYVRRHAHHGAPRLLALDGQGKWGLPAIGTPKPVDVDYNGKKIGSVLLYPVGTWDIKTEIAGALRLTEQGPDATGLWPRGAMRFPDRLDLGFFEQLTAEVCKARPVRSGYELREWIKIRARNEQLDLAVYARALARHETVRFADAEWAALAERRLGAEADLVTMMQSDIALETAAAAITPPVTIEPPPSAPAAPPPAAYVPRKPGWLSGHSIRLR